MGSLLVTMDSVSKWRRGVLIIIIIIIVITVIIIIIIIIVIGTCLM